MSDDTIALRLSRLELSNRRLRLGMILCGVVAIGGLFVGAERAATPVSATSFRLVDADGKLRAELGSDKQGTFFYLNDENGKLRASIAAQSGAAFLSLKDPQGKSRVAVLFDADGAGLRVKDEGGITKAMLLVDDKGPVMQLRDDSGKARTIETLADVVAEPRRPDAAKP
jgi:hypothetical protein